MIMRVGGRFPYLHEPAKSTGEGKVKICDIMYKSVCSLTLFICLCTCVRVEGVQIADGRVDSESKHNNKLLHQPLLVQ